MRFAALLLSKSRWLSGKTNLHSEKGVELAMRVQTPLEAIFFFFIFFSIFSFLSAFYNVLEKFIWKNATILMKSCVEFIKPFLACIFNWSPIAQMVEHLTLEVKIMGSIPTRIIFFSFSFLFPLFPFPFSFLFPFHYFLTIVLEKYI